MLRLAHNDLDFGTNIINKFGKDVIGEVCKNDETLFILGRHHYQSNEGNSKMYECQKSTMNYMRTLVTLKTQFVENAQKDGTKIGNRRHVSSSQLSIFEKT